jgi:hypothetical protein
LNAVFYLDASGNVKELMTMAPPELVEQVAKDLDDCSGQSTVGPWLRGRRCQSFPNSGAVRGRAIGIPRVSPTTKQRGSDNAFPAPLIAIERPIGRGTLPILVDISVFQGFDLSNVFECSK